jgi:hypothetical protein
MAIHTLPNGAEWDDELSLSVQVEDAQIFWENVQSTTPISVTEPSANPNMDRLISNTWVDTSYDNFDYQIKTIRSYQYPPIHKKAFALSSCNTQYQILSK